MLWLVAAAAVSGCATSGPALRLSATHAEPELVVTRHRVEKGQTLSLIVQAYREKGIKVTMDQVLKANPGLKPEKIMNR